MKKTIYIAAFAISTLIFIFGILLGSFVSEQTISQFDRKLKDAELNMESTSLRMELLSDENIICNTSLEEIDRERDGMGRTITYLEDQLGKTNEDVIEKKTYYFLIEVKEFLLIKKIKTFCNKRLDILLYFYSNVGDCPSCEAQGYTINDVRSRYPEYVSVFAFDINYNNTALNSLKEIYGVRSTPSLVINEMVYNQFMSAMDIKMALTK